MNVKCDPVRNIPRHTVILDKEVNLRRRLISEMFHIESHKFFKMLNASHLNSIYVGLLNNLC